MGLFVALLNEELVREKRTMRNYKTAVVGTGECEIILQNGMEHRLKRKFQVRICSHACAIWLRKKDISYSF